MSLSYTSFCTLLSLACITIISEIRLTFVRVATRKTQMRVASGCAPLEGVRLKQTQLCRGRIFCPFRKLQCDSTSRNCTASLHGLPPRCSDAGWGFVSPRLKRVTPYFQQNPEKIPPEFPRAPLFSGEIIPPRSEKPCLFYQVMARFRWSRRSDSLASRLRGISFANSARPLCGNLDPRASHDRTSLSWLSNRRPSGYELALTMSGQLASFSASRPSDEGIPPS